MRQIALFVLIGLILLAALNVIARVTERDLLVDQMGRELEELDGHDAITMGGSVGVAIDYTAMCANGVDYYWDGQDLFETIAIARLALAKDTLPRRVLLTVVPAALAYDNAAPGSGRTASRRTVHRLLERNGHIGMIGGDWRQTAISLVMPALGFDAWGARINGILADMGLRDWSPGTPQRHAARDVRVAAPQLDSETEAIVAVQAEAVREMAYYDPSIPERSEENVLQFVEAVRRNGGQVTIIVTPMPAKAQSLMRQEMPGEVERYYESLPRFRRAGAQIIDGWQMDEFSRQPGYFADPIHLNTLGSERFSRNIAAILGLPAMSDDKPCDDR